jgi:hypothetical protein
MSKKRASIYLPKEKGQKTVELKEPPQRYFSREAGYFGYLGFANLKSPA